MPAADNLYTAPDGRVCATLEELCRSWGISSATYRKRLARGMTPREALQKPAYAARRDHLGNVYKTKRAMCAAWGITEAQYDARMSGGWPLEYALTLPKHANIRTFLRRQRERAGGCPANEVAAR